MGGVTVSKIGKDIESVKEKVKQSIIGEANSQVEPDSDVAIFNPDTKESHLYRPKLISSNTDRNLCVDVEFEEIDRGRNIKVALAASGIWGTKPTKEEPWVGCVHLHT